MPQQVLTAPWRPLEAMPTYRLIDVLRCLERDPAALQPNFAGKIVLIVTTLPEEDRKRSPDRFMPPTSNTAECVTGGFGLERLGSSNPRRCAAPGGFILSAA